MSVLNKVGGALGRLILRAQSTRSLEGSARAKAPEPMGPGTPITPHETRGTEPRRWIYPSGINIAALPRSLPGLTSFQELRNFANSYDVLRICIETRKQQMRGLRWDVVVRDPMRYAGLDFADDINAAVAFFSHPDGRMPFGTWLSAALEDTLVIDALTIYKRRDRAGRLLGLELVDGATIKPIIDEFGRPPASPAPAYQQFAYGFAWADFSSSELLYRPYNPRTFLNYGLSPVEQIIVTVNIALARQISAINHYREGNTPAGFGEVPKEWSSEMIRQFEEMFNGLLAGDFAARARIKMVPSGFSFKPWIDSGTTFNPTYDEYLARIVCAAFGVPPTQFIRSFNRATADSVEEASTVSGFDPLKEFVERLMDEILVSRDGLNMPYLRFTFTSEKLRDEQLELQKNVEYLKAGVLSIDDVLVRLGMEPIGVGRFVSVPGQGIVPLTQVFPESARLEHREDNAVVAPVEMTDAERADLGKWMRKALRVAADGGVSARFSFESGHIEPERKARIEEALVAAGTTGQISAVFNAELRSSSEEPFATAEKERWTSAIGLAIFPSLKFAGEKILSLALERSGISKRGFDSLLLVPWLDRRAPQNADLGFATGEYFDEDDFKAPGELAETLADALAVPPSSAGFPRVPTAYGTSHSMRPGALPSCFAAPGGDAASAIAAESVAEAMRLARARFNRLIDIAHERHATVTELRNAALRATDFSELGASAIAERALQKLAARGVTPPARFNADV